MSDSPSSASFLSSFISDRYYYLDSKNIYPISPKALKRNSNRRPPPPSPRSIPTLLQSISLHFACALFFSHRRLGLVVLVSSSSWPSFLFRFLFLFFGAFCTLPSPSSIRFAHLSLSRVLFLAVEMRSERSSDSENIDKTNKTCLNDTSTGQKEMRDGK